MINQTFYKKTEEKERVNERLLWLLAKTMREMLKIYNKLNDIGELAMIMTRDSFHTLI